MKLKENPGGSDVADFKNRLFVRRVPPEYESINPNVLVGDPAAYSSQLPQDLRSANVTYTENFGPIERVQPLLQQAADAGQLSDFGGKILEVLKGGVVLNLATRFDLANDSKAGQGDYIRECADFAGAKQYIAVDLETAEVHLPRYRSPLELEGSDAQQTMDVWYVRSEMLQFLAQLAPDSVDVICLSGLEVMDRDFGNAMRFTEALKRECNRVLKNGGYVIDGNNPNFDRGCGWDAWGFRQIDKGPQGSILPCPPTTIQQKYTIDLWIDDFRRRNPVRIVPLSDDF